MAVKSDGSDIRYLPIRVAISEIEPDDENARQRIDPGKVAQLAQSMRGVGQLQPVLLIELKDAGLDSPRYRLRGGTRRRAAAISLGWSHLDGVVIPPEMSPETARLAALVDNIQREQLTGYEQAAAFQAMVSDGKMSPPEIARLAGVSLSQVGNQLVQIENLAPEILEQWRAAHPLLTPPRLHALASIRDAASGPDHEKQLIVWQRVLSGTVGGADASPAERRIADEPAKLRQRRDVVGRLQALDRWFVARKKAGDVVDVDAHEIVRYLIGARKTPPVNFPYKEWRTPHGHKRRDQGERQASVRRPARGPLLEVDGPRAGEVLGRAADVGRAAARGEGLSDAPGDGSRR